MVEIIAAAIGALLGIASTGIGSVIKRDQASSTSVARLTAAVEHIAGEVSLMREEFRDDRSELFGRLGHVEQRLAALEAHQK